MSAANKELMIVIVPALIFWGTLKLGEKLYRWRTPGWWNLLSLGVCLFASVSAELKCFNSGEIIIYPLIIQVVYSVISLVFFGYETVKEKLTAKKQEPIIIHVESHPLPKDRDYIYCLVALQEGDYYYRTYCEDINEGDFVYVTFGYRMETRVGKVLKKEVYNGQDVPYPLEKTRLIDEKIPSWKVWNTEFFDRE